MFGAMLFMILGAVNDASLFYYILCIIYGVFRSLWDSYLGGN